jgi:Kef-type K+ transport system membrane component KefB
LLQQDISGSLVLSILIVFGVAKLAAEVFERLGQPGIVGEILAGVLIGPSVFAWIAPNEVMSMLGELGIVFLMFRVGLEVKAPELVHVGPTAMLVAASGVLVPFLAGWGICVLWHKPLLESIFVGAAMTATSVGITAEVLARRGVMATTSSRIILAAAVIDDVLALLVLGAVSSVAHGAVNVVELVLTPVFAMIIIVIAMRWGSRTAGQLLRRLERLLRVSDAPFVLTIILLFGLAALSAKAGVAAITGAFLAGTASSEAIPQRVREQTFGIAELFLPFFLAGIGLYVKLSAFENRSTLLLAVAILIAAILSKVLACGLGALPYGYKVARRVGLGMIPRGEFCIVAAQVGLTLGVIPADTYAVVVAMAVGTTMLAPPLVEYAFREAKTTQPTPIETPLF